MTIHYLDGPLRGHVFEADYAPFILSTEVGEYDLTHYGGEGGQREHGYYHFRFAPGQGYREVHSEFY